MNADRQARLRIAVEAEVLGWMKRTGHGYRLAARHYAADIMGAEMRAEDIKYLSGRFHRWADKQAKREANGTPTVAQAFAAALPRAPATAPTYDDPEEVVPSIPGSLADLAVEGSEEEWITASLRQIENAIVLRGRRGSDFTAYKKLATDLRRRLGEIREPPDPSLEEMADNERRALLLAEVPSWPTYVLEAASDELQDRREALEQGSEE